MHLKRKLWALALFGFIFACDDEPEAEMAAALTGSYAFVATFYDDLKNSISLSEKGEFEIVREPGRSLLEVVVYHDTIRIGNLRRAGDYVVFDQYDTLCMIDVYGKPYEMYPSPDIPIGDECYTAYFDPQEQAAKMSFRLVYKMQKSYVNNGFVIFYGEKLAAR